MGAIGIDGIAQNRTTVHCPVKRPIRKELTEEDVQLKQKKKEEDHLRNNSQQKTLARKVKYNKDSYSKYVVKFRNDMIDLTAGTIPFLLLKNIRNPEGIVKMPDCFDSHIPKEDVIGGNSDHKYGTSDEFQNHYREVTSVIGALFKAFGCDDIIISDFKRIRSSQLDNPKKGKGWQGWHMDKGVAPIVVDGKLTPQGIVGYSIFVAGCDGCGINVGGTPNLNTGKVEGAQLVRYNKGEVVIIRCDTLHKGPRPMDIAWLSNQMFNYRGFMSAHYVSPNTLSQVWFCEERKTFTSFRTQSRSSAPDYEVVQFSDN
jgi:hypothetical protein